MRGDSIRDLYAKTLAVAGLGLLAAAGAIVDYWPAGGQLPALTHAASLRPQLPVLAKNVSIEIPAPSVAPVAHHATTRRFSASLKTITFAAAPLASAPVIDVTPAPELVIAAPDVDAFTQLATSAYVSFDVDVVADLPQQSSAPSDDDRAFLSGALQRTKDTLKDARSFLGTKLGNIAGAFRKVSPFWDSRTLSQFH